MLAVETPGDALLMALLAAAAWWHVDGTVRTYDCRICGEVDELVELAEQQLAATRRELTQAERDRYLS